MFYSFNVSYYQMSVLDRDYLLNYVIMSQYIGS